MAGFSLRFMRKHSWRICRRRSLLMDTPTKSGDAAAGTTRGGLVWVAGRQDLGLYHMMRRSFSTSSFYESMRIRMVSIVLTRTSLESSCPAIGSTNCSTFDRTKWFRARKMVSARSTTLHSYLTDVSLQMSSIPLPVNLFRPSPNAL